MPRTIGSRKQGSRAGEKRRAEFKAALALARMTVETWCELTGITMGHLYQVLREERESPPLIAKIDAFIERHLPSQDSQAATA